MSKRLTESQIVAILKEAESGMQVPELCRTHGMFWSNKTGHFNQRHFIFDRRHSVISSV